MVFVIIISKLIALLLRLFGKGATTLPGRAALYLKYNILTKLSHGVRIICVTGTNGKTTTCALIEHVLKCEGKSYFINNSGANMISGVTTSFILNSTVFGRCKKELAVLECDENSFPLISRYIDAEIVVVTNVFRDQLDRYGEVDFTLSKIREGIFNMPKATLILNADDPLTYTLSKLNNKHITFGLNADFEAEAASDGRYCPNCKARLKYKTKTFAQLGSFYCPMCAYRRKTPDVYISDISELGFLLNVHGKNELSATSLGGVYNLYNYCAAAAALYALGIKNLKSLSAFSGAFGRMERFKNGDNTVLLLLVKNPVGLSGCIKYASSLDGQLDIAFALNDNEADSTDVSWIWDSDFTPLANRESNVYTLGKRSLDMALRLKYDGIKTDKIFEGEEYKGLIKIIKNSGRDFIVFSTYTSMMNMREYFISTFGGRDFWK